jgi:hypothetical protein
MNLKSSFIIGDKLALFFSLMKKLNGDRDIDLKLKNKSA